ncbi:MAG: hypothetical protein WC292_07580 [Clostridia bacterium]
MILLKATTEVYRRYTSGGKFINKSINQSKTNSVYDCYRFANSIFSGDF